MRPRHHNLPVVHVETRSRAPIRNLLLAAGIVAVLGTLYAFGSAAPVRKAHSDGLGAMITDTVITARVKSAFAGDARLDGSTIDVATTNGVVTLKGKAISVAAKDAAEDLAEKVAGVRSVDDNRVLTPNGSKGVANAERVVSDSWITTKAKSVLLADSVSRGVEIRVDTRNGVVVLEGELANDDAVTRAKDIVSRIDGVKSVNISALKTRNPK